MVGTAGIPLLFALLHRVDARLGLTEADYALLNGWLHQIRKTI